MMQDRARETAAILLRLGAVSINTREPFTYTSGIKDRRRITKFLVAAADEAVGVANIDLVAGTATAGIPFAAWLADSLQRPMVYVRGATKGHGLGRQIEGRLVPRQRAIVVEDLITTGGSSLATVDALSAHGAIVSCCLAIFSYGLAGAYEKRDVLLVPLTTLDVLLEVAVASNYITQADAATVSTWAAGLERG